MKKHEIFFSLSFAPYLWSSIPERRECFEHPKALPRIRTDDFLSLFLKGESLTLWTRYLCYLISNS
ncbi:unnamed protein product [Coffea canephora]|uniref:DH200=94 genomic scaffold, scaffold_159 n=1 Tax=Coffea canephora TaxID=49390 RepID=A0A068VA58_COFCA|nr:unnamed protein product [Coffea canephora]